MGHLYYSYVNLPEGTFTHYTTITGNYQTTRTMFVRHELKHKRTNKTPGLVENWVSRNLLVYHIFFPF